jgi:hypothetical protein
VKQNEKPQKILKILEAQISDAYLALFHIQKDIMWLEIIFIFRIWGNSLKVCELAFYRKLNIYFGYTNILLVKISLFIGIGENYCNGF